MQLEQPQVPPVMDVFLSGTKVGKQKENGIWLYVRKMRRFSFNPQKFFI
ncbi:hypothetical protein HMPREF0083_01619 [Aneurinibacillus aneurinilyticus ATCC 12856]|uniref:Uncharacterized protein n=1 Tax=Aneurinibacillus aneurinilyticus ATCC 12856 TaxID=649747 RepID=U1X6X7_ANEAE|nr:hypothetical protein HMPREF0083_01619 [Aneurinibacillus aneurinilyticus ATCC 12856]